MYYLCFFFCCFLFFFQAEDGIRDLVRSRGLGDVYKRQARKGPLAGTDPPSQRGGAFRYSLGAYWSAVKRSCRYFRSCSCLLYTSDAADERSSVDLGGRRIIKKKKQEKNIRNRS